MAILFKDWLDMFINNGFDSENITHWPEEGSEPIVVEELPEDPEFGKIYYLSDEYSSGYYTVDAHDNWINLSEGVQPGGIVEVDDLPDAPEDGVVYHLTDNPYAEDGYYVGLDFPGNSYASSGEYVSKYLKLDYLDNIVGSDPGIPYTGNYRIFERGDNNIWAVTSDNVFTYTTSYMSSGLIDFASGNPSDAYDIVKFLNSNPNQISSGDNVAVAYFKDYNSSGDWSVTSNDTDVLLEPTGASFQETSLDDGDLYIATLDNNGNFISMSSGALFGWRDVDGELNLGGEQIERDATNLLSDITYSSGSGSVASIYYPSSDHYNYDDYPFIAFTAEQVESSYGEYTNTGYNFIRTRLKPDWLYYYVLSSGKYYLNGTTKTSDGIAYILTNSNITDIFFMKDDPYGVGYTYASYNNNGGYWLEPNTYSDYNTMICHRLWGGSGHPLDTSVTCRLLNYAYTGNEYGDDSMNQAFFPLHNSNSYSASYEAVTIPDIHTPMIFLTGSFDGDRYAGAMATDKIYYRYIGQYGGNDVRVGEATLPAAGSSTTITIDGVTYTISRAA